MLAETNRVTGYFLLSFIDKMFPNYANTLFISSSGVSLGMYLTKMHEFKFLTML